MSLVTTPAVVLQTYRYSETSKVVRLATRELGIQSAIAKGVLRPKSRFGAGLEFLSEGEAQLYYRDARELHTLAVFDVSNLRRGLARDVARFAGAAALTQVMLKMAPPAPLPAAYGVFISGLDLLASVAVDVVDAAAVRALWALVTELGFGPSLRDCVRDGTPVEEADGGPIAFSTAEGGVLCRRCAVTQSPPRLPSEDYRDLVALNDPTAELPSLDAPHAAAHRRLAARFVRYHLDTVSLSALDFWERSAWTQLLPIPAAL
jgi:DNA repair protein RecO (recombination protein O)